MRGRLIAAAVAVTLLLGAGLGLVLADRQLSAPLGAAADGYLLEVPEGQAFGQLVSRLAADGVLQHPQLLRWYARWQGTDQQVQAGEYLLTARLSARQLLARLVSGQVFLHSLTVVEGWTVRDLLAALGSHPAVFHTLAPDDPMALVDILGLPAQHPEGWFFPDTYRFPRGTSDREILRQAYELMAERLAAAWQDRAGDLPLRSPYEALILASVVERETALPAERARIAGVFVRRLERGMRLQTDPTVIYGIGPEFDGNLRRRDLQTDTPYNTYTRSGLPPTPIALPGEASLLAAVRPAPGDELYFVATGKPDGSHRFSATLEEHNAAVAEYLRNLRQRDAGG